MPISNGSYDYAQLRRLIRNRRCCLHEALQIVGRESADIWTTNQALKELVIIQGGKRYKTTVAQWHLAFIAKELIVTTNDYRSGALSPEDIARFANWYTNLPTEDEEKAKEAISDEEKRFAAAKLLIPMTYEQLTWQKTAPLFEMARAVIIYIDICGDLVSQGRMDVGAEFLKITGLTIGDFLCVGFTAFTLATSLSPAFDKSQLIPETSNGEVLSLEKIDRFLERTSISYAGFREQAAKEDAQFPGYEKDALNPLLTWPILKTDKNFLGRTGGSYVTPVPMLILDRVTQGIYWEIVRGSGARDSSTRFHELYGEAFQIYVGRLLADYFDEQYLFPEQQYRSGKNRVDTCDWFVLENDTLILIECKTRRLSLRSKVVADRENLIKDIELGVGKALAQIGTTLYAIRNGLCPQLPRAKNFRALILFSDHVPPMMDLLDPEIIAAARQDEPRITEADLELLQHRTASIHELEEYTFSIPKTGLLGMWDPENWNAQHEADTADYMPKLLRNRADKFFEDFFKTIRPSDS